MERPKHRVSCKIALFNKTKDKILLVKNHNGNFGIPGGHLEVDEKPESAMIREIKEELGIDYKGNLKKADFWIHQDGKLILGFVGQIDESTAFGLDDQEFSNVAWTDIEQIKNKIIHVNSYNDFILNNC